MLPDTTSNTNTSTFTHSVPPHPSLHHGSASHTHTDQLPSAAQQVDSFEAGSATVVSAGSSSRGGHAQSRNPSKNTQRQQQAEQSGRNRPQQQSRASQRRHSEHGNGSATQHTGVSSGNGAHLLGFHYLRPERHLLSSTSRGGGGHHHKAKPTRIVRFNKDSFIAANFRFVLSHSARSTYYALLEDSDKHVDWNSILLAITAVQVRPEAGKQHGEFVEDSAAASDDLGTVNCSICLEPAQVPTLTRCAHLYCLPCIYQYLAISTNASPRCPTCLIQNVHVEELKPCVIQSQQLINTSDVVEFRLMQRYKDCTLPTPYAANTKPLYFNYPIGGLQDIPLYSRCVLSKDNGDWINQLRLEQIQNAIETVDTGEEPDRLFYLKYAMEELLNTIEASKDSTRSSGADTGAAASNPSADNDAISYWYQAADGQLTFISPLAAKMMRYSAHDDVHQQPVTFKARVLSTERLSVDNAMRERLRFLRHVPRTAIVTMAHIDLSSIVSAETMEHFSEEVAKEARQRRNNAKHSKRLQQQADQQHLQQYDPEWASRDRDAEEATLRFLRNDAEALAQAQHTFPQLHNSPPLNTAEQATEHEYLTKGWKDVTSMGFASSTTWVSLSDGTGVSRSPPLSAKPSTHSPTWVARQPSTPASSTSAALQPSTADSGQNVDKKNAANKAGKGRPKFKKFTL